MKGIGWSIAGALAMSVACAAPEDEMAFGPNPATVGGSAPAPSDEGDDDGDEDDTGDDGSAEPPADDGGGDDGTPPPSDDGTPPPSDDDGGTPPPPPPGDDDGGPPPVDATPNCQAYCGVIEMCGWLEKGETAQDCAQWCSEPLDMGPCDAAWDVLAGCLGSLDCATLEALDTGMGTACQAEIMGEEQACSGA